MAVSSFTTPLSNIRYIGIYENSPGNKSAAKSRQTIKSEQGAHGICNGTFFNPDFTPCSNALWINGTKRVTGYHSGYRLDGTYDGKPFFCVHDTTHPGDYIGGFSTYKNGALEAEPNCPQPATRRVALCIKGTNMLFYFSDSATFSQVGTELSGLNVDNAVMLDGGGSVQFDFGSRITAVESSDPTPRIVPNFLLFYFKDQAMPSRAQGDKGPAVSYLQKLLKKQGFNVTDPSGTFGTSTAAAVTSFNMENGRSSSVCDATTWRLLGA